MSTITQSNPSGEIIVNATKVGRRAIATGEGSELYTTYFEYMFCQGALITVPAESQTELSEADLIAAAAKVGTFHFWDSPEEEIYNDLVNE
ncbi:MAG: hypothetical protein ABSH34_20125 [Verrucomicrobiota bacterium]|jgi:hypothetical protein